MKNNDNKSINIQQSYRQKKIRGDRKEAWIIKDLGSFTKLVPHLMKSRNASAIYFKEKIDVTDFVKYVQAKNQELSANPVGTPHTKVDRITYFHVFIAALVRLFTVKPHMNRFITGRKYYQRKKIEVAFVAKKEFTEEGEETIIKKAFDREETLWSIVTKLHRGINTVKKGEADDATDTLDLFAKMPGQIIRIALKFLDLLNHLGSYPQDLYRDDPMQSSIFITNLGSIGIRDVPYHHLFDRGTNSVFICLGEIYKDQVYHQKTDRYEEKYLVEISTTIDERISDGFYFINAMNKFKKILNHPEELEKSINNYPVDQ